MVNSVLVRLMQPCVSHTQTLSNVLTCIIIVNDELRRRRINGAELTAAVDLRYEQPEILLTLFWRLVAVNGDVKGFERLRGVEN